jgi:hypothetical protein
MMGLILAFVLLFLVDCSGNKEVKPEALKALEVEDEGFLSTFGPVVIKDDEDVLSFKVFYYTQQPEKGKLIIFRPADNIVLDEKSNSSFHKFIIRPVNELTVFQILSFEEVVNKKIVKITLPHSTPYKFAVFGGFMENEEKFKSVCSNIGNNLPVFVIHTGNMVKKPRNLTMWTEFFKACEDFFVNSVFLPVLTENEITNDLVREFFNFEKEYYMSKYSGLRVFVLNTDLDFKKGSKQYRWFEENLKKAGTMDWKVVVLLESPFSSVNNEKIKLINTELLPLFESYKVNLVLNGGRKGYERYVKNNVTYVRTSCGELIREIAKDNSFLLKRENDENFIIIEVLKKRLLGKVYNWRNEMIDEFQIIE